MKFSQRLAYYLLGLLIGSFAVYYFLDAKDTKFCYLPNCRVLKDLRSKPYIVSDKAHYEFSQLSKEEINTFLTLGDIDFKNSNIPYEGGKLYIIEGKNAKLEPMTFKVINHTDKVIFDEIIVERGE
ncbi:DUF4258 domain-containing protein [Capnocytophaga sp. ARDL2]|uniref:DUF4258 domain-containing protein n=1 Tax=Capnocytophaga sp. ARDL2 TaxID=3238809 RepID=UPI0035576157